MLINLRTIFIILFISFSWPGYSQIGDSLMVTAMKEEKLQDNYSLYTVIMKNVSDTPICILHSIFINLFYEPPQKLAVADKTKSADIYSLEYSARDTLFDYEGSINNFNGEIILPLQEIKFKLLLLRTNKERELKFEYVQIENFCYPEFKNEIFKNATQWYKKYKRIQRIIELP
jgi:hypothetical protein